MHNIIALIYVMHNIIALLYVMHNAQYYCIDMFVFQIFIFYNHDANGFD